MSKEGLFTTVVGSFPLKNTPENMFNAFVDQINLGIDYPCYPQLVSMTEQFLAPLKQSINALKEEKGKYYLSGDFKVPSNPVALEYGEFIVKVLKENPLFKTKIKGTKACLTGPFTLTSEILLSGELAKGVTPKLFKEPRGIHVDYIVDKFAEIMKNIGKAYSDMGINLISMDEPILGLMVGNKVWLHSEEFVVKTLNKAFSGIKDMPSVHVCGKISPKLRDLLLSTNARILDHEFSASESNFNVFEKKHFENSNKYLAMGSIRTNVSPKEDTTVKAYVESLETVKNFIKKGIEKYGKENLFIKPDCGLRLGGFEEILGYKIALGKLNNMVLAVKSFK